MNMEAMAMNAATHKHHPVDEHGDVAMNFATHKHHPVDEHGGDGYELCTKTASHIELY